MLKRKSIYSNFQDEELFDLVKKDNIDAFEILYHRHWTTLLNTAFKRLSSREKAEDIIQNIFIDLYQRRSTIAFTISLKTYLHKALKYKILNEFRANWVRARYQENIFFIESSKNDFADLIDVKELEVKIDRALNELPEKCKQVFVLSRKESLSNKDIATGLNISVSTVEKHISKALKRLREEILN